MTNEAVKRYDESSGYGGVIQDYIVADGTGIEKGTLLKLTDPRTASASSAEADVCAGIAAREKVANDGHTRLSVYKKGYFDMVASGAIAVGSSVISAGELNAVKSAAGTAHSGAAIIGYAEETASDAETILVRLDL
jgi:hypothetical protein